MGSIKARKSSKCNFLGGGGGESRVTRLTITLSMEIPNTFFSFVRAPNVLEKLTSSSFTDKSLLNSKYTCRISLGFNGGHGGVNDA